MFNHDAATMEERMTKKTAGTPDENTLIDLSELFKIFGDSTRIKILFTLLRGERPVNEIAAELNMTQSAISHQRRILKTSRLIKAERDGKLSIYSLADSHVKSILSQGLEHVGE